MPYGIQQPAISGQLSQLEDAIGVSLFYRRPFGLTSAGTKLFEEIEPFFKGLEDLPDHVREQGGKRLGIAAPATVLREFLPKVFAGYKKRYPRLRLALHDANQASAEELLRKREIDVAITELEGKPSSPIRSRVLIRIPLVLLAPGSSKERSIGDFFRDQPSTPGLISLRPEEVISKQFQAGLRKAGHSWTPAIEVSSIDLVELYTSLGFGVGLSVAIPGRKTKSGLRPVILQRFPPVAIAALWCGELTEPAVTFLKDIQTLASKLGK